MGHPLSLLKPLVFPQAVGFVVVGVGRDGYLRDGVGVQLVEHGFDAGFELLVVAGGDILGEQVFDIGTSGAMPWFSTSHSPLQAVDGVARSGDVTAVEQRQDSRRCRPGRPRCGCR
jgi:hypothetical protein